MTQIHLDFTLRYHSFFLYSFFISISWYETRSAPILWTNGRIIIFTSSDIIITIKVRSRKKKMWKKKIKIFFSLLLCWCWPTAISCGHIIISFTSFLILYFTIFDYFSISMISVEIKTHSFFLLWNKIILPFIRFDDFFFCTFFFFHLLPVENFHFLYFISLFWIKNVLSLPFWPFY